MLKSYYVPPFFVVPLSALHSHGEGHAFFLSSHLCSTHSGPGSRSLTQLPHAVLDVIMPLLVVFFFAIQATPVVLDLVAV
jgi:hypothetical protein